MVRRISAALLAMALLIPQAASAAGFLDALTQYKKGNLKFGKLAIHPYASISQKYDDNIYLTPKNKADGSPALGTGSGVRGSGITDVTGGLKLELPITDMHQVEAGYEAQGLIYSNDPSANNAFNQKADGAYKYKGPMGISAKAFDSYVNTADPATSELVQRTKRWQNTAGLNAEYAPEGGMFFGGVQGTDVRHKYIVHPANAGDTDFPALLDRYEETGGVRAGYMLEPKSRLYVSYDRQVIHYTVIDQANANNRKNSKAHLVNVGMEGKIAPKLKGQIQGGIVMRKYDEASADRKGYTNGWNVDTNLTYNPLERTEIRLGLRRGLNEATFGINRYYTGTSASLNVKHKLPYKLTAMAGGSWGMDQYPQLTNSAGAGTTTAAATDVMRNRRDDMYSGTAGLDYDLQEWIALTANYSYKVKYSVFSQQFNYKDNISTVGVKMTF